MMAGKDDLTQHMAPAGVEATTSSQLPQSQQTSSEAKRSPPRSESRTDRSSAPEQSSVNIAGSSDLKVPRGMLDRTLQAQLGRQLRSIYADIASEPVPERFIKLLEELEAEEKRQ
jgi:hypothetical protein